ncbi:MAG: C_GCAxxG_C_C family protein, partial [bacterium]|nr:C_GCAxxG_C_C family protein [bacterium]
YGRTAGDDLDAKEKKGDMVTLFLEKFEKENDYTQCSELLDCDITTPEGKEMMQDDEFYFTQCSKFIESAVRILNSLLEEPFSGLSGDLKD